MVTTPTPTYQQPPVAANADSKGVVPVVNGEPAGTTANPLAVNVVAGGAAGAATEATLGAVEALLATPATALPPTPLMTPGDLTSTLIDTAANTDIIIAAAAGAGVYTRIYRGLLTITGAATTLHLYDDASAGAPVKIKRWDIPANGGIIDLALDGRSHFKSQANKPLVLKQTGGAQISGSLDYAQSTVA